MKPGWLFGIGLVLGGLLTGLAIDWAFTRVQRNWLTERATAQALHAADSTALAVAQLARTQAAADRQAAEADASRLRGRTRVLTGQIQSAKDQLAQAGTVRDSLEAALAVLATQDAALATQDATIRTLDVALAAAARQARADSVALGIVTGERDRLLHLVETAPVGQPTPKLLGVLPRPRCVLGAGAVANQSRAAAGVGAMCGFPIGG